MHVEAGEAEARHADLPGAEHVAFAAQPQVLLGDAEAVLGLAHDGEPRLGGLAERRLVEQEAGRAAGAAPDAAAQLVQLRQAEALGVLDHHHGRLRHVDADLDHRGGDQEAGLARGEPLHGASFSAPFMRPCTRPTMSPKRSLQHGEAFLGGGEIAVLGFLDQRADPIDPPALGQRAADRVDDLVEAVSSGRVRVSIGWRPAGFSRSSETSMSPK